MLYVLAIRSHNITHNTVYLIFPYLYFHNNFSIYFTNPLTVTPSYQTTINYDTQTKTRSVLNKMGLCPWPWCPNQISTAFLSKMKFFLFLG